MRPDRIKPVSQVPGARTPSGTILDNWARRSGALGLDLQAAPCPLLVPGPPWQAQPPLRLQADHGAAAQPAGSDQRLQQGVQSAVAPAAASAMPQVLLDRLASWQASSLRQPQYPAQQPAQHPAQHPAQRHPAQRRPRPSEPALERRPAGLQRPRRLRSGDALPATDIPAPDSAALLAGIRLQLGAAATGGGAPAGRAGDEQPPSTFAFCIDVSSACRQLSCSRSAGHSCACMR